MLLRGNVSALAPSQRARRAPPGGDWRAAGPAVPARYQFDRQVRSRHDPQRRTHQVICPRTSPTRKNRRVREAHSNPAVPARPDRSQAAPDWVERKQTGAVGGRTLGKIPISWPTAGSSATAGWSASTAGRLQRSTNRSRPRWASPPNTGQRPSSAWRDERAGNKAGDRETSSHEVIVQQGEHRRAPSPPCFAGRSPAKQGKPGPISRSGRGDLQAARMDQPHRR